METQERVRLEEQEGMQPASTSSINHGAAGKIRAVKGIRMKATVWWAWVEGREQRAKTIILCP